VVKKGTKRPRKLAKTDRFPLIEQMTDDICQCLKPVIRAVKAAGGVEAARWAGEMRKADRVGFICHKELTQLQGET
jgi:hypothetical protein